MRPLQKAIPEASQFSHDIHNVLMNHIGDFCCVCERKLHDVALVWHKKSGNFMSGVVSAQHWADLILLCHNCTINYNLHKGTQPELLLPDEHITFKLDNSSPYIYELKPTTTQYLDEEGTVLNEESGQAVIVSGSTKEATQTIATFALNTPYYNSETGMFSIPQKDYLSLEDRRVEYRTQAWQNAVALAQALTSAADDSTILQALIANTRQQIIAIGFWSTWMTALDKWGVNLALIKEILSEEKNANTPDNISGVNALASAETPLTKGPGYHNPMPGTYSKWIN